MPENDTKTWWYLSFADQKFNGACIVEAVDIIDAVKEAHRRGINPGGQVAGNPIPDDAVYDPKWRNKLLSKADLQEMFPQEVIMTRRERMERN